MDKQCNTDATFPQIHSPLPSLVYCCVRSRETVVKRPSITILRAIGLEPPIICRAISCFPTNCTVSVPSFATACSKYGITSVNIPGLTLLLSTPLNLSSESLMLTNALRTSVCSESSSPDNNTSLRNERISCNWSLESGERGAGNEANCCNPATGTR